MQRLFSMFPNGLPGIALLLLRLAAGIFLIHDGTVELIAGTQLEMTIVQSVAIATGILLIVGLWTPVAGALTLVIELLSILLGTTQMRSDILLAVLGAALTVLGPGDRSLDSLRYGRRRFVIPHQ